jgi:hypothetical protein
MPAAPKLTRAELSEASYRWRLKQARTDLATFIETCGQNEEGGPIELDWIHRAWIWHVHYCWSRGLHAMIQAPMESGKSSALVAPLAAWLIGLNPNVRIKVVCNGDALAERRVGATKRMIESRQYREVFPWIRPGSKWATMEFEVAHKGAGLDATMQARGVMSKGVGLRADYMIFDDVVDQLNARDDIVRNNVKLFVRQTWLTRLAKPNGRALWIATPWHNADATMDLMHDARFCTLVQRVRLPDLEFYEQELFNGDLEEYRGGLLPAPGA